MPDTQNATADQDAAAEQDAQRNDANRDQGQSQDQRAGTDKDDKLDIEKLSRALEAERKRTRDFEREVKRLGKEVEDATGREKTELQKMLDRAEKAERTADERAQQYRAVKAEQAVRDAAESTGARNPRAVYRLIKDDLEVADDGTVTNLDDAIKAAKRDTPELFQSPNPKTDAGAKDESDPAGNMNDLIRRGAGRKR